MKILGLGARPGVRTLKGWTGAIRSMAVSPDGRLIATASGDSLVTLWDIASGIPCATLKGHERMVLSVAFSPDGKTIATGGADRTGRLWDAATRAERLTLRGPKKFVTCLAFTADGNTLASAYDGVPTVSLWDVTSGRLAATLTVPGLPPDKGASCLAIAPDAKTLFVGSDHGIAACDIPPESRSLIRPAASPK